MYTDYMQILHTFCMRDLRTPAYFSLFSVAVLNTMTKGNIGRKELICLTPVGNSSSLREFR